MEHGGDSPMRKCSRPPRFRARLQFEKIMPTPEESRFLDKFREQLHFVARSSEAFDGGDEQEAFRLANALRLLFHDTASSTSLIKHLGWKKRQILSSLRGANGWKHFLAQRMDFSSAAPMVMMPLLGNNFNTVSIYDWWKLETVFTNKGDNYSRSKIILSAANKDGGSHVDAQLEKYYEVLCAGEYAIGVTGQLTYDGQPPFPQGVTQYPKNAHLALIRQFAHEFVQSVNYFAWLR
jgi:hypothetical protein